MPSVPPVAIGKLWRCEAIEDACHLLVIGVDRQREEVIGERYGGRSATLHR